MEEDPLMVVANRGLGGSNFDCRWNLYYGIEHDRGHRCPLLLAFNEMASGGDHVIEKYREDAVLMFRNIMQSSGRSKAEIDAFCKEMPDFVKEEELRIATVLSKWQTNSHNFPLFADMDQSCLYRYTSKMQHSCEPNCVLVIDSATGCVITRTLRKIAADEELTNDYTGGDKEFHAKNVKDRRKQLSDRGFCCLCVRCERESSECS